MNKDRVYGRLKTAYSVLLAALLAACSASKPSKEDDVSIANPNQHIAMAATVAMFYCEKARWPNSIDELEAYSNSGNIPLPEKINWSFIRHPHTEFEIGENIFMRIPGGVVEPDGMTVSSTHSVPECDGKNVKTNFHMYLGG